MYGKNFVICDQERQYAKQLLQIFSSRHAAGIRLYLFYTIEELQRFALQKKIHILLIAEEYSQKQREEIAAESKYVLLRENRELPEGEQGIFRYQSAEAIWTRIVKSVSVKKQEPVIAGLKMRGKLIGIYSPVQRIGKTRFAISLGKKLAEKEPVLYLNLEAYSGEGVYFPEKPEGNLGDLLYYQRQEKDQLGIRISTIAGQLEKLDYIYPLSCLQDLKAVKKEDWITLFGRICKECIYGKVILDLSDCVDGLFEILECCDIVYLALATDDDILILDPESEFTKLVEALGGQVVKVSATSDNHLNAMDMDAAYGNEKNPLIEKSEFILSVFEQLVGAGNLSAKEKSILDRCAADVYRDYIRSGYTGEVPTLKDMYRQLMLQPEEEARGLALSSELFINGSLNTFAQPTNVNKKNRIMDYDIRELGEQLMPLGMLVTLDSIFNRVIQNWKEGKTTWIFADEFYLLFRYEYSANFFYRLYKRIRKYNGFVTGLTQNVEELLKSDTARLMLANSEFLILLNQASTDREELAALLNISENQLSYITNVAVGSGLIRCSGNIVPFENTFPKNTELYKLMTTKPGES